MENEFLVTLDHPNSQASEQYRRIRTNIEYASVDRKVNVINLTSVLANESKSTTACNLSIMFANKVNRVLLIDADLRKPSLHRYLGLKSGKGLTDLILAYSNKSNINEFELNKYIQKFDHQSVVNQLDILIAGTKVINPAEFIGSKVFKKLIADLSQVYDFIIIDSSPCGFIVDGIVTSTVSDGTVFVSQYGRNKIEATREAIENLKKAGAEIVGGIITKAPAKSDSFTRHYDQYSYYTNTKVGDSYE